MAYNPTERESPSNNRQQLTVGVKNKLGLHLRPASQLVKLAAQYSSCEIYLTKGGQRVNAKSIMGVIMLAAEQGSEILIEATGARSADAARSLAKLISGGFGED